MKKVIFCAFWLTAVVSLAQEPPKTKTETRDTTGYTEHPIIITPQQTDIEPKKKRGQFKVEKPKKETPEEGDKKKKPKRNNPQ